ncbi:phage baseplate assembly protein V [Lacibacterium aquatile]|uniref:Phage baseplate assembly protein V n=1 Tax=Lacibacterium aquatile TaxID=1168082 RepID=A0ABW5DV34_9PROT
MGLSLETWEKAMAPFRRRIYQIVNWGVIRRVDTSTNANSVQIEMIKDEISDGVFHAESYGMSAAPLPGARGVVLCIGGEKDSAIICATPDQRHRPLGLPVGDVCLYTSQDDRMAGAEASQHRMQFTADRTVVLTGKTLKVLFNGQSFTIDENGIEVKGTQIHLKSASGG